MKLIRDPIHGYIEVPDKIVPIISHPFFQRLRHIKQTALAYMVYPGMNHSRFEHSLGAMHLSLEFLKYVKGNSNLDLDQDTIDLIGVTALLHDIGHMPFSHTFENALSVAREVYGLDVLDKGKKTHVYLGIKIIEEVLGSLIEGRLRSSEDPVKFIINVLSENPKNSSERLAALVISNFIDADRSDYLLRDSYYAGVEYGQFDIERLKRFLYFNDGKLAVMDKALPVVEQFLLARMYMFKNVYFHSVVGLYNAILSHSIAHLLIRGEIRLPEEVTDLLNFDDNLIISKLSSVRQELRNAILYRQGFKRIKIEPNEQCLKDLEEMRDEINSDMRSSNGLFLYHEFNDIPYQEEREEAVYILTPHGVDKLKRISTLIGSLSEVKRVVFGYHPSAETLGRKYLEILNSCNKN
ncbi:MAG: HD domain-containing protein [Metallosphaera sp.]|uniref:HD domain-containing protein n=1 Tax=Metallosphaera sp. TaxID=2020860 RepID=UPI0031642548